MSEPSRNDPQLPLSDSQSPNGREPALSGARWPAHDPGWLGHRRAADVFAELLPGQFGREVARSCRKRTLANWWAQSGNADLMIELLPAGEPFSAARRQCLGVTCRFVRYCTPWVPDPDHPIWTALDCVERAALDAIAPPADDVRQARAAMLEFSQESVRAVGAALAAGVRGGEPLRGRTGRVARAVAHACSVWLEAAGDAVRSHMAGAIADVAGAHWSGGPGHAPSMELRDRIVRRCADIIRDEYPDISAVLAERQAEMNR